VDGVEYWRSTLDEIDKQIKAKQQKKRQGAGLAFVAMRTIRAAQMMWQAQVLLFFLSFCKSSFVILILSIFILSIFSLSAVLLLVVLVIFFCYSRSFNSLSILILSLSPLFILSLSLSAAQRQFQQLCACPLDRGSSRAARINLFRKRAHFDVQQILAVCCGGRVVLGPGRRTVRSCRNIR
jgi:hypothetical protein